MATQTPPAHNSSGGVVDHNDVDSWKTRFNAVFSDVGNVIHQKSPETAREYHSGFFGCCSPIDTCLMTYCLPCVTFGKTHHRLHKDASLTGYSPINTSCLLFYGAAIFGLHWVPQAMQRSEVRERYNLKGSCLTDIGAACCCVLCDLVQQDKEVTFRQAEQAANPTTTQYAADNTMAYEAKGEPVAQP